MKTQLPKFNLNELEEKARLARLNLMLGTNFTSLKRNIHLELSSGGGKFAKIVGSIEHRLINLFGRYFWDPTESDSGRSPEFGEMHLEFTHTLDILPRSGKIELTTHVFVADGQDKPHTLFYMLDQGIPATPFPDGSAMFPMRAEERTSSREVNPVKPAYLKVKYKVVTINGQQVRQVVGYERTRDRDEATQVRIEPGEMRPAIPARNWSSQVASQFRREFDPEFKIGNWTVQTEVVEFKG